MKPLLDFLAQKWNLPQANHIMFSLQLWRKTPHALCISKFQYHQMQVNENPCLQKLETKHGHGLKVWKNWAIILFSLTEQLFIAQSPCPCPQRSWVQIPLSHLNFSGSWDSCLNCPASARIISSVDFKHHTSYNTSFWQYLLIPNNFVQLCIHIPYIPVCIPKV